MAIAYAPDRKTSIRAGAGIYYDHYGQSLINIFDQNGSFGLSTSVTNPAGQFDDADCSLALPTATRFPFNNGTAPTSQSFPIHRPTRWNFAITWGLDSKLKTPYSEAFDSLRAARDSWRLYA